MTDPTQTSSGAPPRPRVNATKAISEQSRFSALITSPNSLASDLSGLTPDNRRLVQRFGQANIPPLQRSKVLTSELVGDQQKICRSILAGLGTPATFVLTGKRGCGKTQFATSVIFTACKNANLDDRFKAWYERCSCLFSRLLAERDEYGFHIMERSRQFLFDVDLLVLDEAHERTGTQHQDNLLSEIVDVRYSSMRPTVLITNETVDALQRSLGSSIVDRVRDFGGVIDVNHWRVWR